ncbi:MAG: GTPase Era [Nitrospiria bacterium]
MSYRSGFVAIVGRPNVGKSTLLNRLLGEKISIVSDKPQTTRNRILGIHNSIDAQLVFFDTPGIHAGRGKLNRRMVQTALASLSEVDLVLLLVDPLQLSGLVDRQITDHLQKIKTPKILGVNKIDLVKRHRMIPMLDAYHKEDLYSEIIPLSALSGENTDRLLQLLRGYLPEGRPFFPEDLLTDQPIRYLAGEMIREKVVQKTWEEVPYASAVEIVLFKEDPKSNLTAIDATIYVEKPSQKGILIGRGGRMLQVIREGAQSDLERLLATRVRLALWVKVKRHWTGDPRFLKQMGY